MIDLFVWLLRAIFIDVDAREDSPGCYDKIVVHVEVPAIGQIEVYVRHERLVILSQHTPKNLNLVLRIRVRACILYAVLALITQSTD